MKQIFEKLILMCLCTLLALPAVAQEASQQWIAKAQEIALASDQLTLALTKKLEESTKVDSTKLRESASKTDLVFDESYTHQDSLSGWFNLLVEDSTAPNGFRTSYADDTTLFVSFTDFGALFNLPMGDSAMYSTPLYTVGDRKIITGFSPPIYPDSVRTAADVTVVDSAATSSDFKKLPTQTIKVGDKPKDPTFLLIGNEIVASNKKHGPRYGMGKYYNPGYYNLGLVSYQSYPAVYPQFVQPQSFYPAYAGWSGYGGWFGFRVGWNSGLYAGGTCFGGNTAIINNHYFGGYGLYANTWPVWVQTSPYQGFIMPVDPLTSPGARGGNFQGGNFLPKQLNVDGDEVALTEDRSKTVSSLPAVSSPAERAAKAASQTETFSGNGSTVMSPGARALEASSSRGASNTPSPSERALAASGSKTTYVSNSPQERALAAVDITKPLTTPIVPAAPPPPSPQERAAMAAKEVKGGVVEGGSNPPKINHNDTFAGIQSDPPPHGGDITTKPLSEEKGSFTSSNGWWGNSGGTNVGNNGGQRDQLTQRQYDVKQEGQNTGNGNQSYATTSNVDNTWWGNSGGGSSNGGQRDQLTQRQYDVKQGPVSSGNPSRSTVGTVRNSGGGQNPTIQQRPVQQPAQRQGGDGASQMAPAPPMKMGRR